MTSESEIEDRFRRYAKSRGCLALKLRIDGENGFPDRTVITPAGVFFVEFKRPGGELRPAQRVWKRKLESMSYRVLVTSDTREAIRELENLLAL